VPDELGLRERKKRQTREAIAQTARSLFAERGFEAVTIDDIARAADVSRKTVFNYFPTKEDLVYWRLEAFESELLSAVAERSPGEPITAAFERFVLAPRGLLAAREPEAVEQLAEMTRMIVSSPALLAREAQIFERYTRSLAELIARETRAGKEAVEPWVVANALMGVHRALVEFTRARIVAGVRNPRLAREVRAQGKRAMALLAQGLASLGTAGPEATNTTPRRRSSGAG
jgi:AcrR family transcriptional regulator